MVARKLTVCCTTHEVFQALATQVCSFVLVSHPCSDRIFLLPVHVHVTVCASWIIVEERTRCLGADARVVL